MTNSSTLLSCSTLISYLKTLQGETLSELYNHPATCLAVFREMPELAKQFVMRLFYVEQAVPQAVILSWVNKAKSGKGAKEATIGTFKRIKLSFAKSLHSVEISGFFLSLRFYVKSILEKLEVLKLLFLPF